MVGRFYSFKFCISSLCQQQRDDMLVHVAERRLDCSISLAAGFSRSVTRATRGSATMRWDRAAHFGREEVFASRQGALVAADSQTVIHTCSAGLDRHHRVAGRFRVLCSFRLINQSAAPIHRSAGIALTLHCAQMSRTWRLNF